MTKRSAFAMLAAFCIASPASLAVAASDGDCAEEWKSADGDGDGILQGREVERYIASYRRRGEGTSGERIGQSEFMQACRDDLFIANAPDKAVMPTLKNAGLTEPEAKDRARAAGFSAVSSLVKNGDGTWHGSAMRDGKSTKIAVDDKGNVEASNE